MIHLAVILQCNLLAWAPASIFIFMLMLSNVFPFLSMENECSHIVFILVSHLIRLHFTKVQYALEIAIPLFVQQIHHGLVYKSKAL